MDETGSDPGTGGNPLRPQTAAELKAVLEAERAGIPFLQWRDGTGAQVLRPLATDEFSLTIGRHADCDIALSWDDRVSRTHALLARIGHGWTLADDGLSRNGTYVNRTRLTSRSVLVNGDTLKVGASLILFHDPAPDDIMATRTSDSLVTAQLTPMQCKVLVALCRPYKDGGAYATPASNTQIAAELFLSVDAVKTHMRGLFDRFSVGDLQQNQKRARVVELAFRAGIVTERDL